MVKGIIENTHIILSKITKKFWFLGYWNFSKIDMYFETEGVFQNFHPQHNQATYEESL